MSSSVFADVGDFKLTKSCLVCEEISDALMAPYEEALSFYIGSVDELSSSQCKAHMELLELLLTPSILEEPYSTIMIHKLRDPYIRLFVDSGDDDYTITSSAGFGIVKDESTGHGRLLDSQLVDCGLMKQWKSDCATLHSSKCRRLPNSAYLAPASPNWLVDINQKCIVPGRPGIAYVALSYVWGRAKSFRAMQSNKQQLQNPGALDSREFEIPRTIRDAMTVVAILEEGYLWVDALCIIQDEESTKQEQLNNMASIYAEAKITIIAKDGSDSSHGLHGIPESVARNLKQQMFKLANDREAIVHPWTVDKVSTPWATRGWTFQEELFSPRKLIFEGQTIRWECSVATWHEDNDFNTITECNDADESHMSQASALFTKQEPNIAAFGHLLAVYNKRAFSYSADTLNALSGILSSLTSFEGGFIWGLPQMFFDLALLWQPEETIIRRRSNPVAGHDGVPPSWTWAGWHGELDTKSWERGLNVNEELSRRVASSVTWSLGDVRQEKWQPLGSCSSSSPANTVGCLLSCQTERCFLSLGNRHPRNRPGNLPPIYFYSLLDNDGKWAGSLRPHCSIPVEEILSGAGAGQCELVSISRGSVDNSKDVHSDWIDEWYLAERPKSTEQYNFHNVLWIGWVDNIAFRRGLGRVVEEVWNLLDREEITLVLV